MSEPATSPWARRLWAFLAYAAGFAAVVYLLQRDRGLWTAVVGGLVFATLMSLWIELRRSRLRADADR